MTCIKNMAISPSLILLALVLLCLPTTVFAAPSPVTYYEHLATYKFNTSSYLNVMQSSVVSFTNGVETNGWNFTKDVAEGSGGLLIKAGTHYFNGSFYQTTGGGTNIYINWELVELLSNGSEIQICRTPTGTSGQLVTTAIQNLSASCTIASDYWVNPGSYLKVKIYGNKTGAPSPRSVNHTWDMTGYSSNYQITQTTYTNDSTAFYCTSCASCTEALSDNTYNITKLNATISGAATDCINEPNITGKTFNCNGYAISGSGAATGIDIQGEDNANIIGCDISGFNTGIYIADTSTNVTVTDCIVHNNTNRGIWVDSSDNISILDTLCYNNTNYGLTARFSVGCNINNLTAYDNYYGIDIYSSDLNVINNSVVHDNDFYGIYIRLGSENNTIWNTYAYNNSGSGFTLQDFESTYNRIYSSTATNNTNDGFYLTDNNWTWLIDTNSNLNGRDGYRLESSRWINVTNGSAFDNAGNGYSYNGGFGYIVAYSRAFDNAGNGLRAWGPTTIDFLTFSDIYSNDLDGVHIEDGCNFHGLRNDSIYGNLGWGFYTYNAGYHVVVNTSIHDNGAGMYLEDSDGSNYTNLILYNNSAANIYLLDSSNCTFNGVESEFSNWGLLIEETTPAGDNEFYNVLIYNTSRHIGVLTTNENDFTNITLGYNKSIGLINWNFLNLTNVSTNFGATNLRLRPDFVSLNDTSLTQLNKSANITLSVSSCTPARVVYRKAGFPSTREDIIANGTVYNTSLTCTDNVVKFNVSSFSGFAADPPVSTCMVINSSGTYTLTNNLTGAPYPFGNIYGLSNTCILIETSDVDLTCNGYNITNNGTASSVGIAVNASSAIPYTNITIRDCPGITGYTDGVYMQNADYNRIQNVTSYKNSENFVIINGIGNNITNNTAYATGGGAGFYFIGGAGGNLVINNTAYRTAAGFLTANGNNFTNNRAYNNSIGFSVNGNNNQIWYNLAEANLQYGFHLRNANNNQLVNNTAWGNQDHGFFVDGDNLGVDNNQLINNTAYSNWDYGFYLTRNGGAGVTNTYLIGNTAYLNDYGYYIDDCSGTNLTGDIARDNSFGGYFLGASTGVVVGNLEAYRSWDGLTLIDARIAGANIHLYNNSDYDLSVRTSGGIGYSINVTNITMDNRAGNFENYTSLDINDSAPSGDVSYTMGWSLQPSTPPPLTHFSFAQKYIYLYDDSGTSSIDLIRWTWLDSEISPPYDETKFELWQFISTDGGIWNNVSGQTRDTANNYIEVLGFTSFGQLGILQNNNTAPSLTVESPLNNTVYDVNTVDLNYTVSDADNITCWYDLDGAGFIQLSNCTNTTLPGLSDGLHNVTVLVNDTLNEQNSSTVYFTIDTTPPTVSIQYPANNTIYNIPTLDLNYTASDGIGVDSCWYYLDGAGPTLLPGCANTTLTPGDGPHNVTVVVNDTANNTASDDVSFTTDATPPTITIESPTNTTYNTTRNVDLNYTVSDNIAVNSCWYFLNGVGPVALPAGCGNTTLMSLLNGPYNLTVFVNDTAGNQNSSNVSFTVNVTMPPPPSGGREPPRCTQSTVTLVSITCPGDVATYRVVDEDGNPVDGARVVIKRESIYWWSDVKYTNRSGEVSFQLPEADQYYITVEGGELEEYCGDTVELKYLTTCPANMCYEDDDCRDTEYCDLGGVVYSPEMPPEVLEALVVGGLCRPVECECGEIYDHRCHEYGCCADSDCGAAERCEGHQCVPRPRCESDAGCADNERCSNGRCELITGTCGYAVNHTWFDYDCCKDEDCPPGKVCYEHACVLYRIETNETGFVGDQHDVRVYPEGQYTLIMTDPDGRTLTLNTDENGYVRFLLETEGQYSVELREEGAPTVGVDVQALKRPPIPPEEKPLTVLDLIAKYFWWLLILLLLIIGYILFKRRKTKKYKVGE